MTDTGRRFRVGDRVRYTGDYPSYLEDYINKGDECVVSEVTDSGYYVKRECESLTVAEDELELVEPYDPKREFLKDLAECLKRHDAKIIATSNADGCTGVALKIGDKVIIARAERSEKHNGGYEPIILTASNIMDFEK